MRNMGEYVLAGENCEEVSEGFVDRNMFWSTKQLRTNNQNVNLGLKVLFLRADLLQLTFDSVVFFACKERCQR